LLQFEEENKGDFIPILHETVVQALWFIQLFIEFTTVNGIKQLNWILFESKSKFIYIGK